MDRSLAVALALVTIGALRFATDTMHELDPSWWQRFEGTPLRYLVRAPSDASILGTLNAQWFKLLSIPAGISLIYLRNRFGSGTVEAKTEEFRDWAVRGVWIAMWFLGFTALELEKQLQFVGSGTRMVQGEIGWLNHLIHLVSAGLAWRLSGWFEFGTPEFELEDEAQIEGESESPKPDPLP